MYTIEAHIYEEGSDYSLSTTLFNTMSAVDALAFLEDLTTEDLVPVAEEKAVYDWSALVGLRSGDVLACTRTLVHMQESILPAVGWEDFGFKVYAERVACVHSDNSRVTNTIRKEDTVNTNSNVVKRTRHFTVCSGFVRAEPGGDLERFDGEVVGCWCDQLQAERTLRRHFQASAVVVDTMERYSGVYTMDLEQFFELADCDNVKHND